MVPFGISAGGMGEGNSICQCLCFPKDVCPSGAQQLSLLACFLPPRSPRAELLTFNVPDVKSHWLSELTQSGPSIFARQTQGLCLAGWAAPPPPRLPPASPCSVHCISALPTQFVGLLSTLGSVKSVLLVFWWFSGLFRQMWVESKRPAGGGEPSVLLRRHFP